MHTIFESKETLAHHVNVFDGKPFEFDARIIARIFVTTFSFRFVGQSVYLVGQLDGKDGSSKEETIS